jgi:uncharacterized protein (TIGR03084 family)
MGAAPLHETGAADPRRALAGSLTDSLVAESGVLRAVLGHLAPADWARLTPAAGWTITDQVTHLAYFDEVTELSVTDPVKFIADAAELTAGGDDYPDRVAARFHDLDPGQALDWFDRARASLTAAYRAADPAVRLPWYGPAMSLASSVTARLMETWAHSQDVFDTVGVAREPSGALRHVADLGIRALRYTYTVRGLPVPDEPVGVSLSGPAGELWTWGPDDATDWVTGTALDFCLVVTQRRHQSDTALCVEGETATQWMSIAQAFAGPAGPGRPPSASVPPGGDS